MHKEKEATDIKQFASSYLHVHQQIIAHVQLATQHVRTLTQDFGSAHPVTEDEEVHTVNIHNYYLSAFKTLSARFQEVMHELEELLHLTLEFSVSGQVEHQDMVLRVCTAMLHDVSSLLQHFCLLMEHLIVQFLGFHKAICKFTYILINVFTSLYSQGFCTPPEEEDAPTDTKFEDNAEGTGLGEGEGNKDVSDKIENEEQALGLQQPENEEQDKKDEPPNPEEGLDMESDFQGELHDVPKEELQNEDNQEQEQEQEMDKQMGEINPEFENVVDEKLWNNEDEQLDNTPKDEKLEQNAPLGQKDNEMRAASDENKDKKKEKTNAKQEVSDVQEFPEIEDDQINEDTMDKYEEDHHIDIQQQEEFKIDDDVKLDETENIQEEEQQEHYEDMMDTSQDNETKPPEEDTQEPDIPQDENLTAEDATEPQSSQDPQTQGLTEEEMQQHTEEKQEPYLNEAPEEQQQKKEQPFGVRDTTGANSSIQQEDLPQEPLEKRNTTQENKEQHEQPTTSESDNSQQYQELQSNPSSAPPKQTHQRTDPNPYRSLGDAKKEWKKRMEIVDIEVPAENSSEDSHEQETKEQSTFKFMRDTDQTKEDAQALAPITEHEKDEAIPTQDPEAEEDQSVSQERDIPPEEQLQEPSKPKDKAPRSSFPIFPEEPSEHEESSSTNEATKKEATEEIDTTQKVDLISTVPIGQDAMEVESHNLRDLSKMRERVDTLVNEWRNKGTLDLQTGEQIWRYYEQLTQGLAQELCEQLRLILEPTLATKLKGDYKTGKRINMKKVIPYIASDFKKDKIWLRRTQPSKRQYQVLLAIDDSESMAENRSGDLACQATTLIAKALSQLEVGELAIVSFGQDIKLLHPFEQPFTSESGVKVRRYSIIHSLPQAIMEFTFKQTVTKISNLLDNLIQLLEMARSRAPQMEMMQLVLIISDGRFSEKDALKKWIREADQKNMLLVFIIIDNPKNKGSSILDIQVRFPLTLTSLGCVLHWRKTQLQQIH